MARLEMPLAVGQAVDYDVEYHCDDCELSDVLCNGESMVAQGHVSISAKTVNFNIPGFEDTNACVYMGVYKIDGHNIRKIIAIFENGSVKVDTQLVEPPEEGTPMQYIIKYQCVGDCTLENVTANGIPLETTTRRSQNIGSIAYFLPGNNEVTIGFTEYSAAYEGVFLGVFTIDGEQFTKILLEIGMEAREENQQPTSTEREELKGDPEATTNNPTNNSTNTKPGQACSVTPSEETGTVGQKLDKKLQYDDSCGELKEIQCNGHKVEGPEFTIDTSTKTVTIILDPFEEKHVCEYEGIFAINGEDQTPQKIFSLKKDGGGGGACSVTPSEETGTVGQKLDKKLQYDDSCGELKEIQCNGHKVEGPEFTIDTSTKTVTIILDPFEEKHVCEYEGIFAINGEDQTPQKIFSLKKDGGGGCSATPSEVKGKDNEPLSKDIKYSDSCGELKEILCNGKKMEGPEFTIDTSTKTVTINLEPFKEEHVCDYEGIFAINGEDQTPQKIFSLKKDDGSGGECTVTPTKDTAKIDEAYNKEISYDDCGHLNEIKCRGTAITEGFDISVDNKVTINIATFNNENACEYVGVFELNQLNIEKTLAVIDKITLAPENHEETMTGAEIEATVKITCTEDCSIEKVYFKDKVLSTTESPTEPSYSVETEDKEHTIKFKIPDGTENVGFYQAVVKIDAAEFTKTILEVKPKE